MNLRGIYGITDESLLPEADLLPAVEQALAGGISLLQYRNKRGEPEFRRQQAGALLEICRAYNVPLIINDDVQLCAELAADGVHLGQGDCTLPAARDILGPGAIIGITCHQSLTLARAAATGGASYVAFGRFFASTTKPNAPAADPAILTAAKQQLELPIVAIGGINADNGASLISAGADMLAVAGGLFSGQQTRDKTEKLIQLFQSTQEDQ